MLAALLLAADLASRIDRIAVESLGKRAGMSIAVVRGGETILAKGYGFANVELQAPATRDTVYHIDSITKHVTAAAILQLADQKKLSLDDPVTKYVPQLSDAWRNVTVRHLLSQTSGVESFTDLPSWGPQERLDTTHDDILGLIRNLPLLFEPGTQWRYSNSGFYLAGMVIEKVTGQPYAAYMREHVFQPLGLRSMQYGDIRPIIPNRASGYEIDRGTLVNAEPFSWKAPFAAGGVCSTAMDLAAFEKALENGWISAASLKAMRSPAVVEGIPLDYGFGTRLGSLGGHRVVGHTGSGGGFRNILMRFPDDDVTIVILSNTEGVSPSATFIAGRIARAVFGIPAEAMRDEPLGAGENDLAGTFESAESKAILSVRDGKLGFQPDAQAPFTVLHHLHGRTFALSPDEIVRMLPEHGNVMWAVLYVDGMFMDALRRTN